MYVEIDFFYKFINKMPEYRSKFKTLQESEVSISLWLGI